MIAPSTWHKGLERNALQSLMPAMESGWSRSCANACNSGQIKLADDFDAPLDDLFEALQ